MEEDLLRRTGRTTRIIDDLIQKLFKNEQIFVRDHYVSLDVTSTNNNLHRIDQLIIERLYREHNIKTGTKEGPNVNLLYNLQQHSFQLIEKKYEI